MISWLIPVGPSSRKDWLEEAVSSCMSQDHVGLPFEVVLSMDGCGTECMDGFAGEDKVVITGDPLENSGVAWALNAGLRKAKYCWIARLDADDVTLPGRVRRQVEVMRQSGKSIIGGSFVTSKGTIVEPHVGDALELLRAGKVPVYHPCVMFSLPYVQRHLRTSMQGVYAMNYDFAEDFALWCLVAKAGGTFHQVVGAPVTHKRQHPHRASVIHRDKQTLSRKRAIIELL